MWVEGGWSDRTAKVYAEVSSLKTSAIALHAVWPGEVLHGDHQLMRPAGLAALPC